MTRPRKEWRLNLTPRFTVLQLGEYIVAEDGPRETLLKKMKFEKLAPSLIYRELYPMMTAWLCSPLRDDRIIAVCIEKLQAKRDQAKNPYAQDNAQYALNALATFERSSNHLRLAGATFVRSVATTYLQIEGVKVSVQPTAIVKIARPRGGDLVGAIIVDPARGDQSTSELVRARATRAMITSAIVLHQHVVRWYGAGPDKPSAEHAIVFHAPRQETQSAPSSHKRELRNIEACCRGIAERWDKLQPPPKFDADNAEVRR